MHGIFKVVQAALILDFPNLPVLIFVTLGLNVKYTFDVGSHIHTKPKFLKKQTEHQICHSGIILIVI